MGTVIQLALERSDDAEKVARFFAHIGLPIHMAQLSLSLDDEESVNIIIESALKNKNAHHMPIAVTANEIGDDAYRRLHEH